jgi:hypothetical protein
MNKHAKKTSDNITKWLSDQKDKLGRDEYSELLGVYENWLEER